ncbi:MAG: ankyrin repeat domain-containing protein [Flavobacterium sp.]|uniref:ankyrin repeat domain-containing protein n=1 Tax=Flavobacterium sp. TaxID=239 RepID=UPI003266AE03
MKFSLRITLLCLVLFAFSANVFSQNDVFNLARSGTVENLKILVNKDPEIINTKNENGFTPLILACYKGNVEVAKFLMEKSKTINTSSDMGTPLMASVVKGNNVITELLLQKGANPDLTDNKGTTALMYAAQFQNIDAIKLLLKYKADIEHKDKEGKTAFEFAVFTNNEEIINILKTN